MPITSFLDNDLYKFTMGQAVAKLYPKARAVYQFKDRNGLKTFNDEFLQRLKQAIDSLSWVRLTDDEADFLRKACPFLEEWYIQFLRSYKYDPKEVRVWIEDGQLFVEIEGLWMRTIFWEVPLLAMISEIYFQTVAEGCKQSVCFDTFSDRTKKKRDRLTEAGCYFADFGTRRRFSEEAQRTANYWFRESSCYVGTSNVHHAMLYGVKPIGTMAHEWIMAISALEGLRHANRFALKSWANVYKGRLGIALTDTYGSEAFFRDFDSELARLFDGVRHDSGDPYEFTEKTIDHYKSLDIDPTAKSIVFSDGLNTDLAIDIKQYCTGRIRSPFGIGTHFTNDFDLVKPLNIVIKLRKMNDIPVVKLSDSPGKEMGEPAAVAEAQYIFRNKKIKVIED